MKPATSAVIASGITALLIAVAWLLLFPVYDTNDDVAIRVFLDGRRIPGAGPSGYAYFVNLALGQFIAWLYRIAPGYSWYDVVEQGTLALTSFVALYCCIRSLRRWDQAAIVALIAAMMLAVLAAIQFTIVGGLSATVGAAALIVALTSVKSRLETLMLSGAGALLLLLGALLRLEAALLGILVVVLTGLYPAVLALRHHGLRSNRHVIVICLMAFTGVVLAWWYHFAAYFSAPDWKEFYVFNFLRGELTEYAAARVPHQVLAQALAAAGWTVSDYEMLTNWLFFDSNLFSTDNLRKVIASLPTLPRPDAAIVLSTLTSYGSNFPFFLIGIAGVIVGSSQVKKALVAALSLTAIIAVIVAISVFLKPLDYRVFWPIAAGTILATWVALYIEEGSPPHWAQRFIAALLLVAACTLVTVQTVKRSWSMEHAHQAVVSDFASMPLSSKDVLVVVGGALLLQALERPFGRRYLQATTQTLLMGTTLRAPPVAQYLARVAVPDVATWLCSEQVYIVATKPALTALAAYYLRHRNQTVSFTTVAKGSSFNVDHCHILK